MIIYVIEREIRNLLFKLLRITDICLINDKTSIFIVFKRERRNLLFKLFRYDMTTPSEYNIILVQFKYK